MTDLARIVERVRRVGERCLGIAKQLRDHYRP
jgi:hypothetical protein